MTPVTSIAEFTLPAGDFPLGRVFEDNPEVTLELDRVVPSGDTVWPYFWVTAPDGDLPGVLAVLDDLTELRSIDLMEQLDGRGLFRAKWDPEYMGIMAAIEEAGVTVVSSRGSADGWVFELRANGVDQFSQFQQYCADHDIDVSLARLSRLSPTTEGESVLTPDQREALVLAYREGYFDEPREIDQESLAAELGISRQALSNRLRRGHRNLIERVVLQGHHDDG